MKAVLTTRDDTSSLENSLSFAKNAKFEEFFILDNCSSTDSQKELLFNLGFSMHVYRTRSQLSSRSLALSAAKLAFSCSLEEHAAVVSSSDILAEKINFKNEDFVAIGDKSFIMSRRFFSMLKGLKYFESEVLPSDKAVSDSLLDICRRCELSSQDCRSEKKNKAEDLALKPEVEMPDYMVLSPIPSWKEKYLFNYSDL